MPARGPTCAPMIRPPTSPVLDRVTHHLHRAWMALGRCAGVVIGALSRLTSRGAEQPTTELVVASPVVQLPLARPGTIRRPELSQGPADRRFPDDRLRPRKRRSWVRSEAHVRRLLALGPSWQHVIMTIDGPDSNPYNPHTVAAIRDFVRQMFGNVPLIGKLERGGGVWGRLHLHLMVPPGSSPTVGDCWEHVTPDGVLVRARRRRLSHPVVRDGDIRGLTRLAGYLRKPAHAGFKAFRARGPQDPRYLAALDAVVAGLAINRGLGHRGLPRTLWMQNLPRQPPTAARKLVVRGASVIPGSASQLSPRVRPEPGAHAAPGLQRGDVAATPAAEVLTRGVQREVSERELTRGVFGQLAVWLGRCYRMLWARLLASD